MPDTRRRLYDNHLLAAANRLRSVCRRTVDTRLPITSSPARRGGERATLRCRLCRGRSSYSSLLFERNPQQPSSLIASDSPSYIDLTISSIISHMYLHYPRTFRHGSIPHWNSCTSLSMRSLRLGPDAMLRNQKGCRRYHGKLQSSPFVRTRCRGAGVARANQNARNSHLSRVQLHNFYRVRHVSISSSPHRLISAERTFVQGAGQRASWNTRPKSAK